ncbi:ATP synthase F0 subunit A [Paenibacillus albiflavus]|uniref:ATP synthase subunit a n=1 Tax=Paenibacillus albiflavus TaxID=2545760 RepID=A0A4R4DXA8_9BACL|nr:F0F1 ATP synthase subunit A [Paenibacillus albiflavus]TCZ69366.1 ATP synthase F0 subunit A [Paenibacillus albiflavus]
MHESPIFKFLGIEFDFSVLLATIITIIIVFIIAKLSVRNLSVDKPTKMQNFMEWVIEFVSGFISSVMDMKRGKGFITLGVTLILFIFVANLLGLPFNISTEVSQPFSLFGTEVISQQMIDHAHETGKHLSIAWFKSPTADALFAMGLAGMVIFMVHFLGMTRNTKGYFKHYFEPFWFFIPLNLIKEFSKLLTLGMRLFGNIFAGEVMIAVILMAGVGGIVPLIAWQGFSIFVGAIQAFIFTVLTMVYIAQAAEKHHD